MGLLSWSWSNWRKTTQQKVDSTKRHDPSTKRMMFWEWEQNRFGIASTKLKGSTTSVTIRHVCAQRRTQATFNFVKALIFARNFLMEEESVEHRLCTLYTSMTKMQQTPMAASLHMHPSFLVSQATQARWSVVTACACWNKTANLLLSHETKHRPLLRRIQQAYAILYSKNPPWRISIGDIHIGLGL